MKYGLRLVLVIFGTVLLSIFAQLSLYKLLSANGVIAQNATTGKNMTSGTITNATSRGNGSNTAASGPSNVTASAGNNGHIYRGGAAAGSGGE
jgi:hypothetical protein